MADQFITRMRPGYPNSTLAFHSNTRLVVYRPIPIDYIRYHDTITLSDNNERMDSTSIGMGSGQSSTMMKNSTPARL